MKQARFVLLFLVTALFLNACGTLPPETTQAPAQTVVPETAAKTEPAPVETAAPSETAAQPETAHASMSWQSVFRSKKLPEGNVHTDEVALFQILDDGTEEIVNVPKTEISAWADAQDRLPRTHYYEQWMDEALLPLLPILDYAFAFGYSRLCVPTTEFEGAQINANARYINRMFLINSARINGLTVATVNEGGEDYAFVLITMPGMETNAMSREYREGVEEARRVIADLPEGLDEAGKVAYIYDYLTVNVSYDDNDYYEGDWCMLYDALIRGKTVCAGYAEAFYFLCNLAGVNCISVEGYVKFTDGEGFHAWSEAEIDGQWYLFDSTWDAGVRPNRYGFYGLSDVTMLERSPRDPYEFDRNTAPACPEDLPPR